MRVPSLSDRIYACARQFTMNLRYAFNPFTAINCNALSAHVTRWRFLNCDSYLGTALCLCSGRFSAEARGTKMFSKAVLYPGLLLFVHQSLSWTVKAIYYHHTLTRATILRFFPTPRSESCTRDLLCCSKLDLGHCRRLCERDNDIINGFQLVPGVSTPPTLLPLLPIMLLLLGEQFVPLLLASARLLQLSECCLSY